MPRTLPDKQTVSRASFLSNMFHENKTLRAFQLERGYSSSVTVFSSKVVPSAILDAHLQTFATRATQRLMKGKYGQEGVHHGAPHEGYGNLGLLPLVQEKTRRLDGSSPESSVQTATFSGVSG